VARDLCALVTKGFNWFDAQRDPVLSVLNVRPEIKECGYSPAAPENARDKDSARFEGTFAS